VAPFNVAIVQSSADNVLCTCVYVYLPLAVGLRCDVPRCAPLARLQQGGAVSICTRPVVQHAVGTATCREGSSILVFVGEGRHCTLGAALVAVQWCHRVMQRLAAYTVHYQVFPCGILGDACADYSLERCDWFVQGGALSVCVLLQLSVRERVPFSCFFPALQ
jgi:hypothetical protein